MRLYGAFWLVVAIGLAAPGAVETVLTVPRLTAWTAGSAVAAVVGLSHHFHVAGDDSTRLPGRSTVLASALGGLCGTITTGLTALLGGWAAMVVVLVVCAHPRVLLAGARQVRRLLRLEGGPPAGPAQHPAAAAPAPAPTSVRPEPHRPDASGVQGLTLPELCWGWRASFTALDRADPLSDYGRWAALVAVRRCYLDELARRDPAGFARWLYAGARPASDPSRYLLALPRRLGPCRPA